MGSDDFFHKRKAKTAKDLARKKEKRSSYDRVLIVCEGEKTEPNYFQELVDCLKLNTANVEIDGSCGSSPISVVKHAKKLYDKEKKAGESFNKVFCVIDKDTHTTYSAALLLINSLKPKGVFEAANSVPCFEYWLLLHFEYTTKAYAANGAKSSCGNLISNLKKYLPNYDKGDEGVYSQVADQTNQAIAFSKRSLTQALAQGTDNPTTYIHELVEYLQKINGVID